MPVVIRELILNYYDQICAQIRTKDWTSDIFKFDIGLFHGCVLSCILFNCVFQLLLDMVSTCGEENGYTFKGTKVVNRAAKTFVVNLVLIARVKLFHRKGDALRRLGLKMCPVETFLENID